MISKVLLGLVMAAGLSLSAEAAMPVAPLGTAKSQVILAYGGCGVYRHRGPYGGCRSGGQWGGYGRGRACPPGFHLGGGGRRCWPN